MHPRHDQMTIALATPSIDNGWCDGLFCATNVKTVEPFKR